MKVLVTGGAGFIGSNVVELLVHRGAKVYVWDDFSKGDFKNLRGIDCEIICGDILDKSIFKKLPQVEAVIHEAAITDTTLKDNRLMMMVNYVGFENILSYCLKKKVKLIYASSAGVYGNGSSPMKENQKLYPLNTYAYSKYLCDMKALKFINKRGVPLIVGLRYFNVYGPKETHKENSASMIYQLFLQMRNNCSPRVFKFGEQKRDFVYIKDVAFATVEALKLNRGGILNIGSGRAGSFNEIISIINKVLGKNLKPEYFDNPFVGVYQNCTEADITLLRKHLGFTPQYSLEKGIEDYITSYLNVKES
ncbi:MAG: ADP-glyceromanno-heptose 6-epimerase [Candidatus Omnitrophica bacterium]|nr:ADP-glyceromanno-heptose 6-epimerase [Candidatus Omnitrophota bacterium]MCM8826215.1 ADP-glyceromanno-heptose 6-epimerase [Candidatus Omnitrophota bacterium]